MTTTNRSWRPGSSASVPSHRWLDLLSGVALVAAVVLLVWPVSASIPSATDHRASTSARSPNEPTAAVTAETAAAASAPDSLGQTIVGGNLFSATRHAPTTRFVVPGRAESNGTSPTGSAMSAPSIAMTDSLGAMASEEPYPRLSGIVFTNGERRALLQLAARDGVASLYRVGDEHAGFRVQEIGADVVVLSNRAGRTRLRLSSRLLKDSLEVHRE